MLRRLALCVAALACCAGPMAGSAIAGGGTLGPAHLGVSLSAPAAPLVGGAPASSVSYEWRRCLPYSTLVAADGAEHLWRLDDSGVVAADALGGLSAHYAGARETLAEGPLDGEGGSAAAFDGKTSAVSLAAGATDYAGVQPYTLELWVRPQTIDGTYRFLISHEQTTAAGRQGTGIWLSSHGLGFERWVNGVDASVDYAAGLTVGAWSHVAATYDGSTMRLYVNGVQVGSRAGPAPLAAITEPGWIGAGAGGRSGFFSGALSEVAVYPRAILRSHVAAHLSAARSTPCATIDGASGATYVPVAADLGRTLAVTVTSVNSHGSAAVSATAAGPSDDGNGQFVHGEIGGPSAGGTVTGDVAVTVGVAGLPADRVEWDVDGQYRYAKAGEPPYQYTWYTAAESNGAHTVTVKVWGPDATTPVSSQVTVHISNPTLHPVPLAFGEESMYALFNEGEPATAQNLLGDVWPARGYPLPYLGWPLTWTENPYNDAYWDVLLLRHAAAPLRCCTSGNSPTRAPTWKSSSRSFAPTSPTTGSDPSTRRPSTTITPRPTGRWRWCSSS